MKKQIFLYVAALILLVIPLQTHANWLTDNIGSLFTKSLTPSTTQSGSDNTCGGSRICKNLPYAAPNGKVELMDLYLPTSGGSPASTVLFLHPGSWTAGSKSDCTTDGTTPQSFVAKLRSNGFAVACIDYRLTNVASFPAQVQDSKAAVRYLRANAGKYNLDTNHIGALGLSAGGNMAALLGTSAGDPTLEGDLGNPSQSSAVEATDLVVGPTYFLPISQISDGSQNSAIFAYLGGDPSKSQSAFIAATLADAAHYVSGDEGPFMLQYGNQDTLVPPIHGQHMDIALKAKGRDSTFKIYNGGHGDFPWEDDMVAFFIRTLGGTKSVTPAPVATPVSVPAITSVPTPTPAPTVSNTSWFARFFGQTTPAPTPAPIVKPTAPAVVAPTTSVSPTVSSTPAPTAAPTAPTLTLSAKPAIISSGKSTVVSWSSTNTTQCLGKVGGVTVPAGTNGSINSGPLTVNTSILFTCYGPGGAVQKTLTITVIKLK